MTRPATTDCLLTARAPGGHWTVDCKGSKSHFLTCDRKRTGQKDEFPLSYRSSRRSRLPITWQSIRGQDGLRRLRWEMRCTFCQSRHLQGFRVGKSDVYSYYFISGSPTPASPPRTARVSCVSYSIRLTDGMFWTHIRHVTAPALEN